MKDEWAIYSPIYGHIIPCISEAQARANAPEYGSHYVLVHRQVSDWVEVN